MCGIVGILNHRSADTMVDTMVRAVYHRGPDDCGRYADPAAALAFGQTRLSILDLSAAGHQPMSYAGGRYWLVFNGEIYNFRDLRVELEQAGHQFLSHTDTEVVLAAYAQWGVAAIRRFRGMFAFALYDRTPGAGAPSVVLARDRLGIKPLLYASGAGWLAFASELRALMASGLVSKEIDPEAVFDYLATGSVFQPRTILAGVKALPPGSWMEVRGSEQRIVRYWDLHAATIGLRNDLRNIRFEEAAEQVHALLVDAARGSMVADVPVGAFLSGGIDSTAAVGFMGEASGQRIRTFSIGFEDDQAALDERKYARLAAAHLGSQHEEVVIASREAADFFPQIVASIDQPSLDGTNTWLVARAASGSVKVAVSGLGGDELFAGYPHFRWIAEAARACTYGWPAGHALVRRLHGLRPNRFTQCLLFRYASAAGRLAMLRRLLDDTTLQQGVLPAWRGCAVQRITAQQASFLQADADTVQQTSYAELNGYLLSTLLRDGDVMSMAHGVEVRPMLLDHPLVEFIYALPAQRKLEGQRNKALFVQAAEKHLPESLRNRRKMGFELPLTQWMAGPLRSRACELLHNTAAAALFSPDYLRRLQHVTAAGQPPRALWAWMVFLAWCEQFDIQLPAPTGAGVVRTERTLDGE